MGSIISHLQSIYYFQNRIYPSKAELKYKTITYQNNLKKNNSCDDINISPLSRHSVRKIKSMDCLLQQI